MPMNLPPTTKDLRDSIRIRPAYDPDKREEIAVINLIRFPESSMSYAKAIGLEPDHFKIRILRDAYTLITHRLENGKSIAPADMYCEDQSLLDPFAGYHDGLTHYCLWVLNPNHDGLFKRAADEIKFHAINKKGGSLQNLISR